jgi:hypothetical protein
MIQLFSNFNQFLKILNKIQLSTVFFLIIFKFRVYEDIQCFGRKLINLLKTELTIFQNRVNFRKKLFHFCFKNIF